MGLRRRSLTTAGLGLIAVLVAGCGSSQGLLTGHDHDQLAANLLAVTQAVDKGNCPQTSDALAELDTTIDGLPAATNATLRKNLNQGASVLRRNAARQCHHKAVKPPVTTATSTTTTTSTATTATSTTPPTSSAPAPTTPPQTTATTPPATQTQPPTASTPGPPTTVTDGGAGLTPTTGGHSGGKHG
jgi:hypothetical protein